MFFIILGNLEPRPLACAAQGCPVSCPGRGQPWKYLRQRTRPRVTARRCPTQRDAIAAEAFEGRQLVGALSRGRVDGCWWGPSSACTSGLASYLALQGGAAPALQSSKDRLAYACWGPAVAQCFRRRHGTVFGLTFGRSG